MDIKVFIIAVKCFLFVACLILLFPLFFLFGAKSYLANSANVIIGYMQELVDIGYITKEEKEELEKELF
jgi:hypothetical protein